MKLETLLMIGGAVGAFLYFKKKSAAPAAAPVAVAQRVSPLREEDSEFFVDMAYPVYPYPYWGGPMGWNWGMGWGGGRGGGGHHHHGRHR
jgi:hypothetical protein